MWWKNAVTLLCTCYETWAYWLGNIYQWLHPFWVVYSFLPNGQSKSTVQTFRIRRWRFDRRVNITKVRDPWQEWLESIPICFYFHFYFFSIGTNWILPTRHLQEVINEVSLWSHQNPHSCCYAPMIIQIFRSSHASELGDRTPERHKIQPQSSQLKPFLLPETHDKFCTVWYDWFV